MTQAKGCGGGCALGLGDPNARQLLTRLNRYGISRDEFLDALRALPSQRL